MVEAIESQGVPPQVTVDANYQLSIEDAATLAEHDVAVFVDASVEAEAPFTLRQVAAASTVSFTSHSVSPGSIVAICREHFGATPETWVLGIRGYAFEFTEGLTTEARENLDKAVAFIQERIQAWRKQPMDSSSSRKKTILIIDDDPDIRASMRVFLEAEGYEIGEAATGEEGLKVAKHIQPDAIIIDLMMEDIDSGSVVAQKLKEENFSGPMYMLSAAGDTVRYNIDARELGLAGIFQKPIDPKTLVATLEAKLKDA